MKGIKGRTATGHVLRTAILTATLGLTAASSSAMAEALEQSYKIAQGELDKGLIQYAADAGVTLHFDAALTADLKTKGLQGNYSIEEGFQQLLQGSGLSTVKKAPGVYVLERQTTSAVPNAQLEKMVITSTRTDTVKADSPQVITVITREQLEQQRAISSDTSQILSNLLPAFSPSRQKLTSSGETFRGRPPLFLVDGVPQSNPIRDGQRDGRTIDMSMIERIEVIHGANAVHGLGATGGIINFITRKPESDSFTQSLEIQGNTPTSDFNSDVGGYKFNYRAQGAQESLEYLLGFSYEKQGLYLDANGQPIGVDLVQGDLMNSQGYDLFAKLGYWLDDDQHLEWELNRYSVEGDMDYVSVRGDRDAGIPTTSVEGRPEGQAPSNQVLTSSLKYSHDDFYGLELDAQAYLQKFEARFGATTSRSFQDASIAPVGTLYDQSQNESDKIGAKLTLRKADLLDNKLALTGGLDILQDTTQQALILTNRTYVPETVFRNYAPFLQAELAATERLVLHGGLRYEYAELKVDDFTTVASKGNTFVQGGKPTFDDLLFNTGAVFKATPWLSVFANYSEGFGMPDVGRVLRGINTPGLDVDSFLNLEPIVTNNKEIGLRIDYGAVDFEISAYQSDSDLGSRLEQVDDDYFVKREKTEISGFEASLGYELNDAHRFSLAYSKVKGEYDSDKDGEVDTKVSALNISPDRLAAGWNAHWNNELSSSLSVNHYFDRDFDNPSLEFDGYTLVDLGMSYQQPFGTINLGVSNLFNEDYITFYSQSALASDDRYFKGRGRLLTLTYSTEF